MKETEISNAFLVRMIRAMRRSRRAPDLLKLARAAALALLMMSALALGTLTSPGCSPMAPTLPLPPPAALSSAPDAMGIVTVSGSGAEPSALISVYNEATAEGVIQPAEADGTFAVQIAASTGDLLLVWQRTSGASSSPIERFVPAAP